MSDIETIQLKIASLRKKVFRLQGQARKTYRVNVFGEKLLGVPADTLPGYQEAVDSLKALRAELRKLQKGTK